MENELISRQAAIDIFDDYNVSVENGELEAYSRDRKRLCDLPPVQPDDKLAKIADLVEGTIDHFDLDDAMDLLYQIKDVLDGSDELPSAQPEPERTMEEFMYGQDMGNPEDGSL